MAELYMHNLGLTYDYDRLETRRMTDMFVVHHTGNPHDDDLSSTQINASHQAQGWTCIGYHFVVRKNGDIEVGRPHWTVGAHAFGENGHTIGIHLSGNFDEAVPTEAQVESTAMLLAKYATDYGLPIDREHIVGHRDLMATDCPGQNLYDTLDTIIGKAAWYAEHGWA